MSIVIMMMVLTIVHGATTATMVAKPAANSVCQVKVSQKTETTPTGNTSAVVITGAKPGATGGGTASRSQRCVYFYGPDISGGSSKPTYSGTTWPYVIVPKHCKVVLDSTIPVKSKLRQAGFVSVQAGTGYLMIGGLPIYQYSGDSTAGTCSGNFPPVWSSFDATGKGTSIVVKYPMH